MNRYLGLLLTLSLPVFADSGDEIAKVESSEKVIVAKTRGLILLGNENLLVKSGLGGYEGVHVKNLDIPGTRQELAARLEPLFANQPLTQGRILEIKKEIIAYYRDHNRPVLLVEIPEQDVTKGVVQMVVIEGRLGEVTCAGNKHFSCSTLKKYIRIHPGDPIDSNLLLAEVAFMNRNHFRRTDVMFMPGKESNTTDIQLVTKDRLTFRPYAGGDNTGTELTGNARWLGGFTWGDVFGWDHVFTYQYTTSTDFHKFQSHTFHYTAPTRYRHNVIVYGGFANIHPNISRLNKDVLPTGGHLDSRGFSSQVSGRYEMPVGTTWKGNVLEFVLGFDYKHMNNNLQWTSEDTIPIVFKRVNLTQLVGEMNYGLENAHHKFTFATDVYWSPQQFVGGGSNHDFNNLRNNAKNHYVYGRIYLGEVYRMPKGFSINGLFRGQASNRALLPSEQFGIGGYNTVRGYEERIFNADFAALATLELHTPSFSLLRWAGHSKPKDGLHFLVFGDYGRGWNYKSLSDEKRDDFLASVGPGLRYEWSHYLTVRADCGFKLHKDDVIGHHWGKIHVGVIASY